MAELVKILRRREVERFTGLRRSSIYEGMGEGTFPRAVTIGRKSIGWLEPEIITPLREVVWVILDHFRTAVFFCCCRCGHVGNALALSIMSTAMPGMMRPQRCSSNEALRRRRERLPARVGPPMHRRPPCIGMPRRAGQWRVHSGR